MDPTRLRDRARAPRRGHPRKARDPRSKGLRRGREGGSDLLSPLPQSQPGRLDRRFRPLPAQSIAGGLDARNRGRELEIHGRDLVPPGRRPEDPPTPLARPPRVPQLVPVRPMNWCVLGFHTNSFHSSTTCPQLFFSFWMTILAAGNKSRAGRGITEKLGCGTL